MTSGMVPRNPCSAAPDHPWDTPLSPCCNFTPGRPSKHICAADGGMECIEKCIILSSCFLSIKSHQFEQVQQSAVSDEVCRYLPSNTTWSKLSSGRCEEPDYTAPCRNTLSHTHTHTHTTRTPTHTHTHTHTMNFLAQQRRLTQKWKLIQPSFTDSTFNWIERQSDAQFYALVLKLQLHNVHWFQTLQKPIC